MWRKFFSDIALVWSKLWSPLLASAITVGFVYLLKRRDERRDFKKRLSAELYIPARRQLSDAAQAIQGHQRALQVDSEMWKRASSSGLKEKLKSDLKVHLTGLYETALPRYDKAWQSLNEEIWRVGEQWDQRYGGLHNYATASKDHKIVQINWWNFLTGDAPVTPIDGLRNGDILRVWNSFMTPERFKLLDCSVEQFLAKRWQEAALNDSVKHYRECRQRLLSDIPKVIVLLDRESIH
jgi:hypothetical protein